MAGFELLDGVRSLAPGEWNALVGEDSPFLEWEWLASLEESGAASERTGWAPRPLVVREGGRLLAACPLYVKGHSEGEFVFDWGWADAAQRAGIDYYPKLLVGVPFTPVTGAPPADGAGRGARAPAAAPRRGAPRGVPEQRPLGRPRQLLPRRRARGARGGGLPAAPRLPVPLAQRRLRELRGLPDLAAQQAPQPGAPRAPRARRAGRAHRGADGRRHSRRAVSADVPALPDDAPGEPLGPPVPERGVLRAAARALPAPALLRRGVAGRRAAGGDRERHQGRRALRALLGRLPAAPSPPLQRLLLRRHRALRASRASRASSPAPAATTSSCAASTPRRPGAATTSRSRASRRPSPASWSASAPRRAAPSTGSPTTPRCAGARPPRTSRSPGSRPGGRSGCRARRRWCSERCVSGRRRRRGPPR